MEDSKRRAFICQQAAALVKKQQEEGMPSKGTRPLNPLKRKPSEKGDHLPKKPKVATGLIVRKTPQANKLPPLPCLGKGKGLMTG